MPVSVSRRRSDAERERLAWGEAWTDSGYVFVQGNGEPIHPHSLSQFFETRVAAAGVPRLSIHGARHTHATLGLAAGVSPRVMQERLGHSSVAITLDLYTHPTDDHHADAAAKVAALLGS